MKHVVVMAVVFWSGAAVAEAPPRVVVQPLAATIPLPGAANAALLTTLAGMSIELPSTFEVDDALAALPARTCAEDEPCLAGLARATKSRWAMAVAFHQVEERGVLSAKVVSAEGVLARVGETLDLATIPATEEAWTDAFRALIARLSLETLGKEEPAVVAAPLPPPAPKPAPLVAPPVQLVRSPSARVPVAMVAGLIAVGAGSAAGALALTNLREASGLEQTSRGGLLPRDSVDRAVALDERTVAATALGIGAGVAAAVAVGALLMKDAPVQLAPSVGPAGPGLTLLGRLP